MANMQRRRVAGWIGILAILLNTFVPALSHAVGGPVSAPWLEICSDGGLASSGAQRRQGDAPAKPGAAAFQHCPYCAPHGASFAAPPAALVLAIETHLNQELVAGAAPNTPARPLWNTAQSRAPPFV
jgi:Protein of unknown function (DUF2946)